MFFKEILDCRIWIWIILSLKLLLQLAEGGPPEQDRQCSGLFLSEEWHGHLNCGPSAPNMGEFIKESKPYVMSTLSLLKIEVFFFSSSEHVKNFQMSFLFLSCEPWTSFSFFSVTHDNKNILFMLYDLHLPRSNPLSYSLQPLALFFALATLPSEIREKVISSGM